MHRVHLVGRASALFDSLTARFRTAIACCDQTDVDSLDIALEQIRNSAPDWVVYCGHAAASSWDAECPNHEDGQQQVEQLARAAADAGAKILLVSSDAVFAGPRIFHDESDPPADEPSSQALQALEQAALNSGDRASVLVVRTHAFGWSRKANSFAERVWQSLARGEPVFVETASYATPMLATDVADLLLRCCRAGLKGVVHIAGAERTSPFRFVHELAGIAGFDRRLVRTTSSAAASGEAASLPRETSLASRLVRRELGVAMPLLRETLGKFVEQAANGWRDQVRGGSQELLMPAA